MPIDINATQWTKDSGLEEGLLSQLKKNVVLEGKSESVFLVNHVHGSCL